MDLRERTIVKEDDNIACLREAYPEGLHFVVGDTHGEADTLEILMEKIRFDPTRDHVYFIGDYNGGGNVYSLLKYMSRYYQSDYKLPGFHMIRGNHERDELYPTYRLENLPDVIVLRKKHMTYYLAHAGMIGSAFQMIGEDMKKSPDETVFAYSLADECIYRDAPLRQLIWSRYGLYSQRSKWRNWPDEYDLWEAQACIIHGHSPYCYFKHEDYYSYGEKTLFWKNQHIYFSESLQAFNIDANVKGRYQNGEGDRRLSCICLEGVEEIAAENYNKLTMEGVKDAPNFVFSVPQEWSFSSGEDGDVSKICSATPRSKRIVLNEMGRPVILEG